MAERWIVDLNASLFITFNYNLLKLKKVWIRDKIYIHIIDVSQIKIVMG